MATRPDEAISVTVASIAQDDLNSVFDLGLGFFAPVADRRGTNSDFICFWVADFPGQLGL